MQIIIASPLFLVALIGAALMGYAIQRGSICMVAALHDVVARRSARKLAAIGESAIWVAACLLIAELLGLNLQNITAYSISSWTLAGGLLLGLGAFINGGCAFGAVARLGSGELAYFLTPVGFFFGSLAGVALSLPDSFDETGQAHLEPNFVLWFVLPFLLFAIVRFIRNRMKIRQGEDTAKIWAPHQATTLIGFAFVALFLAVGSWSYTNAIAELSHGISRDTLARMILFFAVLAGALWSGRSSGKLWLQTPSMTSLARCFVGGALMGIGGSLIPGSNDALILIGLPLLQPHAWAAMGAMCCAIMAALKIARVL